MRRTLVLGALLALTFPAGALAANFAEHGTARVSPSRSAGCRTIAQGCLDLKGGIAGKTLTGALEATITVDWKGSCGTAGGTVILSNAHGDSLDLDTTGKLCRVGGKLIAYNGTWSVEQGSGKYATLGVGHGKLVLRQLGSGLVRASALGNFSMTQRQNH